MYWVSQPIKIPQNLNPVLRIGSLENPLPILIEPESLITEIRITNTGHRTARVYGTIAWDSVSFYPALRTKLRQISAMDSGWNIGMSGRIIELAGNETVTVKFLHVLRKLEGLKMTLQYLIIYEDEGKIHDSYYWAAYNLASQYEPKVQDYFQYVEDQRSYHTYSEEQSALIKEAVLHRVKMTNK